MKKSVIMSTAKLNVLFLFILSTIIVAGCAKMWPAIPDERTIYLTQTEPIRGDFKYESLQLNYKYQLTGGNLALSGKITYRDTFDSLDVRVLLLDSTGKVLQRKLIYSSGYRTGVTRVTNSPFQKTFAVPVNCTSITFTSSGQARSGHK